MIILIKNGWAAFERHKELNGNNETFTELMPIIIAIIIARKRRRTWSMEKIKIPTQITKEYIEKFMCVHNDNGCMKIVCNCNTRPA